MSRKAHKNDYYGVRGRGQKQRKSTLVKTIPFPYCFRYLFILIANHTNYWQHYLSCARCCIIGHIFDRLCTAVVAVLLLAHAHTQPQLSSHFGSIGILCLDDHMFWHAIACFGMSLMDSTRRSGCVRVVFHSDIPLPLDRTQSVQYVI